MRTLERGGLTFDIHDGGSKDGELVVLLHGFPEDATCWNDLAVTLHREGYRTLAPDQRGYSPGARPTGRAAYKLTVLVDDVIALLDAAGAANAHIVGHDWGAVVAWALAAWHPERVRTLTALSVPHPHAFHRALLRSSQLLHSWYMVLFQLPVLPEWAMRAGGGRFLARNLRGMGLDEPAIERYVARMSEPGALTAALNWYRALGPTVARKVGKVAVPTLYVWSTEDGALTRAAAEASERFVTGPYRFEVLEGFSHWLPDQAAAELAPLILEHLRAAG